jgi:hypothetical protein
MILTNTQSQSLWFVSGGIIVIKFFIYYLEVIDTAFTIWFKADPFTMDKERWKCLKQKSSSTGDDIGLAGTPLDEVHMESSVDSLFKAFSIALYLLLL